MRTRVEVERLISGVAKESDQRVKPKRGAADQPKMNETEETVQRTKPKREAVKQPVMLFSDEAPQRTKPNREAVEQPAVLFSEDAPQRTKPKREAVEQPVMLISEEALQRSNPSQRRNVSDQSETRRSSHNTRTDARSEHDTNETWTTYHTVPIIESRVLQPSPAVDKYSELSSSALHVQQMYEQGDFDQEISVSQGEYIMYRPPTARCRTQSHIENIEQSKTRGCMRLLSILLLPCYGLVMARA